MKCHVPTGGDGGTPGMKQGDGVLALVGAVVEDEADRGLGRRAESSRSLDKRDAAADVVTDQSHRMARHRPALGTPLKRAPIDPFLILLAAFTLDSAASFWKSGPGRSIRAPGTVRQAPAKPVTR